EEGKARIPGQTRQPSVAIGFTKRRAERRRLINTSKREIASGAKKLIPERIRAKVIGELLRTQQRERPHLKRRERGGNGHPLDRARLEHMKISERIRYAHVDGRGHHARTTRHVDLCRLGAAHSLRDPSAANEPADQVVARE